ncbi:MAG: hypothetical protein E7164_01300 [Firmicutes bacterium]|nr:hypothetical protein [Bacillota bacterium]
MVEELKKIDFKIMGVITNNYIVPNYNSVPLETIIPYKLDETKKITLLNIASTNNLSTKNNSKLQLASSINDKLILLYDFSKGLNCKEINYYKLLFQKMTLKYNKKIILFSKDINFLSTICDTYVIYDKKVIYKTNNIFDDKLYSYVDMPNIVKFIKIANKKGAMLTETLDINELIKDIYRRLHANKDNI